MKHYLTIWSPCKCAFIYFPLSLPQVGLLLTSFWKTRIKQFMWFPIKTIAKRNSNSRRLFKYFSSLLQIVERRLMFNNRCWWLDSNPSRLIVDTIALSTVLPTTSGKNILHLPSIGRGRLVRNPRSPELCWRPAINVTKLCDLLHFGQLFKAPDDNYFSQIRHIFSQFL